MELTAEQRAMLNGDLGRGKAMAMGVQVGVGKCFDAPRMVPVQKVHVFLSAQEADVWFSGRLLEAGAFCAVAPTVNPGYSLDYFRKHLTPEAIANMEETHRIYQSLGARLTYSCTPYLGDNVPEYGEAAAFSETNATIFVNAVLGARTNRESAASALCAAVTGFVPEYGMLLEENRLGTVAVEVGAQLNVSGSYDLFHIPGVTAECRRGVDPFGGREPLRRLRLTSSDLEETLAAFSPDLSGEIHFCILGCPHYTYDQVCRSAQILNESPAAVPVWILTSAAVVDLAWSTGVARQLEQNGAALVPDTCVDEAPCWGHLAGQHGFTDSPKCAYYMRAFGVELEVANRETCLNLAAKGGKTV